LNLVFFAFLIALLANVHGQLGIIYSSPIAFYAAMSLVPPHAGRLSIDKHRPRVPQGAPKRVEQNLKLVSNAILGRFQKSFMADPPRSMTVTIGKPSGSHGGPIGQAAFTTQIHEALGVTTEVSITYHGSVYLIERFEFTVTGGHPYCQPEDPCYGYAYQTAHVCEYFLILFSFHFSCILHDKS
jgi:hypothetical protein